MLPLVLRKEGAVFLSRKEIGGPNPEVFHSRFFNDIQYIICKTIRMYTVDIWMDYYAILQ